MTGVPVEVRPDLTADEARALTDRIKAGVAELLPVIREAFDRRADAALGYESWAAYCDTELRGLRLPVGDRRAAVAELRQAGMSTRAIGSALGIGQTQVRRDLELSPNGSVEPPERVHGLDGKDRPASAPPREHISATGRWYCQDCAHSWPVESGQGNGCPVCGGRGGFEPPEAPRLKLYEDEPYAVEPAALSDGAGSAQAVADQIAEENRESIVEAEWSDEEEALHDRIQAGQTIVVSLRGARHANLIAWAEAEDLYVRVDRRTEWGNPFEMPDDGDRATVIRNYALHYLPHKPALLAKMNGLRGKALGCWCAPEPCHGDVLRALAESDGDQAPDVEEAMAAIVERAGRLSAVDFVTLIGKAVGSC